MTVVFADSGIESCPAMFDRHHRMKGAVAVSDEDEAPPSFDTVIQRLAETIKEIDHHNEHLENGASDEGRERKNRT